MYSVPELYSRRRRLDWQTSTLLEQLGLRLGMWYWKDETRTLEFRSFMPAVELKEKGKKGRAVHFAEMDGSASERLTDKRLASRDATKALEKRGRLGCVTLDDVKFVVLLLLQDSEKQRICSFTTFMRCVVPARRSRTFTLILQASRQLSEDKPAFWRNCTRLAPRNKSLDNFLMALLYYLAYYLEKNSLEKKPKSYMVEKISDTQKDWKFFECFYTFCTYVAWVVFRRQHLTEIEEEVGRLFRTSMFNIPRRKREDEELGGEKKRMTFVQFRRMMAKRPAIKKAINMRSPVMSTLLPSHREKAQTIVEKKYLQVGAKLPAQTHLDFVPLPKAGILGEPRSLFNPHTLLPLEPEETVKAGRHPSLIERNNMKIQDTLHLVMRTLSSHTPYSK
nr:protein phosphatase 1 regulatory subunit 36 isoform X2 [Oryctolagus cuniculus]